MRILLMLFFNKDIQDGQDKMNSFYRIRIFILNILRILVLNSSVRYNICSNHSELRSASFM